MNLHHLLDFIEKMAVEAKVNEGGDALQRFYFDLYKPEADEVKAKMETEDTDTDFDSFAALGMQ